MGAGVITVGRYRFAALSRRAPGLCIQEGSAFLLDRNRSAWQPTMGDNSSIRSRYSFLKSVARCPLGRLALEAGVERLEAGQEHDPLHAYPPRRQGLLVHWTAPARAATTRVQAGKSFSIEALMFCGDACAKGHLNGEPWHASCGCECQSV